MVKPKSVRSVVRHLLAWYGRHARDLPWRRTSDPYAIWVSEIMLQQTQVKTVVPYFERWMSALPTIEALAAAKPGRIHKLWEGLGYYTRVRNLQQAARLIVQQHDGKFPTDYDAVLALPGIGRYTAGAICSIAFNQATPILDGNVIRVLTRLFAIPGNPKDKTVNAHLWQLAERLVQTAQPVTPNSGPASQFEILNFQFSIFNSQPSALRDSALRPPHSQTPHSALNQSLMELGALLCTPRNPRCDACPVRADCAARRQNRVADFPALPRRAPATNRRFAAFVLRREDRYLVRQRPAGVVNAHLWEFPNVELANGTTDPQAAFDLLSDLRYLPASGEKMSRASNAHCAHEPHERRPVAPLSPGERGRGEGNFFAPNPPQVHGEGNSFRVAPKFTEKGLLPSTSDRKARSIISPVGTFPQLIPLCSIKHTITRYRITLDVFHATVPTPSENSRSVSIATYAAACAGRWLTITALRRLPFTSAHKKILAHLPHLRS